MGFFRRQIILSTKEKDPNRKDDPYIAEKMCAEAEGIFLWALEGLHRLIANDYKFTVSQSAQDNMDAAVSNGNNIIEFLSSEGYIRFKADYGSKDGRSDAPAIAPRISRPHRHTAVLPMDRQ